MRILVLILTLAFGAMALAPALAEAQAVPTAQPAVKPGGNPPGVKATVVKKYPHNDRVESSGYCMCVLLWVL